QQRHVHRHIFLLQTHRRGYGIPRPLRILRWRPRLHFSVAIHRQRRRRFHGRVRQHRRVIFRLYNLPALRERLLHIPVFPHHFAGLARRGFHFLPELIGIPRAVLALFPLDLEFLFAFERRPRVV